MFVMQEALDQIHTLQGRINSLEHNACINPNVIDVEKPPVVKEAVLNTNGILDWLLNTATQAQVEQVFAAIGCRWGEARNKIGE